MHLCFRIIDFSEFLILVFYLCRLNIGILREEEPKFFVKLERLNIWMSGPHIDACINVLCKGCHGPDNKSFNKNVDIVDTTFFLGILSSL